VGLQQGSDQRKIWRRLFRVFQPGYPGFIDQGWVKKNGDVYLLTKEGKFFADKLPAELFR